jgi:hypothetical protein
VFASAARDVLTIMAPRHPGLPVIEQLAARLEELSEGKLRLLEDDDRDTLRAKLMPVADLGVGDLAVILNSVPGPVPTAAEGAGTLDGLVQVLEIAATPQGEVPALIRFLATLATRKPELHDAVWAWIDARAPRLNLEPAQLDPLRGMPSSAAQRRRVCAALAVIDENPYGTGRYQLSRWLRWDNGKISDKHDEGVPRSMEQLRYGGEGMLEKFHEILRCNGAGVVEVEFFLPISAINLDVDMWRVGHGKHKPLVGYRFCVVIHSSDRLNDSMFHEAWKQRWEALSQSNGGESVRWLRWADEVPPTGDLIPKLRDYDVLTAMFAERVALCCLGLHQSSAQLDMQVTVATQAGVPALLWRRDGGDVSRLRELLSGLAARGRLTELPAEVTALRRDAAGEQDDHPGRHLSLIWDDYDEREALIASLRPPQEAQGTDNARR